MNKKRFFRSFLYAMAGVLSAFRTEQNFRFHLGAALVACALAVFLHISLYEWLWIALSVALVFGAELMNTAIESLANRVSAEHHPMIRVAKDCGAGAVLVMSIFALICGLVIFGPKVLELLF